MVENSEHLTNESFVICWFIILYGTISFAFTFLRASISVTNLKLFDFEFLVRTIFLNFFHGLLQQLMS